jgi:hypothetical protein
MEEGWKGFDRENAETVHVEDARHLIRIYQDLITFKKELLRRADAMMAGLSDEARGELLGNDIPRLRMQLRQYQERLEFWYRRLWELEGIEIDHERMVITFRERVLELTRREYQLLVCLIRHPSQYVSARRLVELAWGERLADEQLRVYVTRLRRKLLTLGVPARIDNRPRRGYCLVFD